MTLKTINFFDGYDTSVTPNVAQIDVSALLKMETDNDYVINKGAEATGGDIYYNTTDNVIRYHNGTIWLTLIDSSHSSDTTIHFTKDSIDHTEILSIGSNTHEDIDEHIADGTKHFTESSINHANISGIGTNSHSTIDTHLANTIIHMPWTIGSNGQVMTVTSGVPSWETPAAAAGAPVGTITPWIGGYFVNSSNSTFTNVLANTPAAVNSLLNSTGWYVCDGSALNDPSSPIFNAAGRYLPNLTDERFLQGNTTAGGVGGSNTLIDHTHTHSLTVAAHTHTFSGTSAAQSNGHTHNATTGSGGGHFHRQNMVTGYRNSVVAQAGHYAAEGSYTDAGRAMFQNETILESAGAHTHSVTTGDISATHTHTYSGTTSGASANSISGTVGTGSAATSTNVRPKYLNVFYIMKVK